MTEGAVLVSKPPKKSQASQWQGCTTGASNLWFTLQFSALNAGPNGIIITIDIDCSLRCTSDSRTSANTIALTTATVSDFYYMALDNVAPGGSVGNVLVPDRSLNTTVQGVIPAFCMDCGDITVPGCAYRVNKSTDLYDLTQCPWLACVMQALRRPI